MRTRPPCAPPFHSSIEGARRHVHAAATSVRRKCARPGHLGEHARRSTTASITRLTSTTSTISRRARSTSRPRSKRSFATRRARPTRRALQQRRAGVEPHVLLELPQGRRRRQARPATSRDDRVVSAATTTFKKKFAERVRHAVRLGLGLARGRRRQARDHEDAQRRDAVRRGRRRRC